MNDNMNNSLCWADDRCQVSVQKTVLTNEVCATMTIWDFLTDPNVGQLGVNRRDLVRAVRRETDGDKRKELKKRLPAAITSGRFESRARGAKMISSTGLLCLDMDGKDNEHITADEWQYIARELHETGNVAYFGRSVGGNGYFALVAISEPTMTPAADYGNFYERAYYYLADLLRELYGVICDKACHEVKRLRVLSYDPAALVNQSPEIVEFPSEVYHPRPKVPKNLPPMSRAARGTMGSDYDTAADLADKLVRAGISMAEAYDDWYKIGFSLARLGEAGRDIYHQVSRMSPKYEPRETDAKFGNCLDTGDGRITIATFIGAARDLLKYYS